MVFIRNPHQPAETPSFRGDGEQLSIIDEREKHDLCRLWVERISTVAEAIISTNEELKALQAEIQSLQDEIRRIEEEMPLIQEGEIRRRSAELKEKKRELSERRKALKDKKKILTNLKEGLYEEFSTTVDGNPILFEETVQQARVEISQRGPREEKDKDKEKVVRSLLKSLQQRNRYNYYLSIIQTLEKSLYLYYPPDEMTDYIPRHKSASSLARFIRWAKEKSGGDPFKERRKFFEFLAKHTKLSRDKLIDGLSERLNDRELAEMIVTRFSRNPLVHQKLRLLLLTLVVLNLPSDVDIFLQTHGEPPSLTTQIPAIIEEVPGITEKDSWQQRLELRRTHQRYGYETPSEAQIVEKELRPIIEAYTHIPIPGTNFFVNIPFGKYSENPQSDFESSAIFLKGKGSLTNLRERLREIFKSEEFKDMLRNHEITVENIYDILWKEYNIGTDCAGAVWGVLEEWGKLHNIDMIQVAREMLTKKIRREYDNSSLAQQMIDRLNHDPSAVRQLINPAFFVEWGETIQNPVIKNIRPGDILIFYQYNPQTKEKEYIHSALIFDVDRDRGIIYYFQSSAISATPGAHLAATQSFPPHIPINDPRVSQNWTEGINPRWYADYGSTYRARVTSPDGGLLIIRPPLPFFEEKISLEAATSKASSFFPPFSFPTSTKKRKPPFLFIPEYGTPPLTIETNIVEYQLPRDNPLFSNIMWILRSYGKTEEQLNGYKKNPKRGLSPDNIDWKKVREGLEGEIIITPNQDSLEWSFNREFGPFDTERGYLSITIMTENGEKRIIPGGGACELASLIYMTVKDLTNRGFEIQKIDHQRPIPGMKKEDTVSIWTPNPDADLKIIFPQEYRKPIRIRYVISSDPNNPKIMKLVFRLVEDVEIWRQTSFTHREPSQPPPKEKTLPPIPYPPRISSVEKRRKKKRGRGYY